MQNRVEIFLRNSVRNSRAFPALLFFIRLSPKKKKKYIIAKLIRETLMTIIIIYYNNNMNYCVKRRKKKKKKLGLVARSRENTTLDTYNIYINILYIYIIYIHLVIIELILHWLWFTSIAIQELESRDLELSSPYEFIRLNARLIATKFFGDV